MKAVDNIIGTFDNLAAFDTHNIPLSSSLKVPFGLFDTACTKAGAGRNCENLTGYLAVYRICFAMACFYFLLMLITIGVKSSKDCRGGVHNG